MVPRTAYDREDIRRLNAAGVLSLLHDEGPQSRARLAGCLGLTRATASNIVSDLLRARLVRETEYQEATVGRPGLLVELNPNYGSIVAIEIDLDRIDVVLANAARQVFWRTHEAVPPNISPEACLARAEALIEQALAQSERKRLNCIGIGLAWAGLTDHSRGELAYGPTSGWEHIPVKKRWEGRFGLPVQVENEAHAGALGVLHREGSKDPEDLVYLSLGVGMAAGIIANGQLLRGARGFAGQVGHTPFTSGGEPCHCGRRGCWVTEIGTTAIRRKLEGKGVRLATAGEPDDNWLELLEQHAASRDPRALAVLEKAGRQVGQGLARLAQTFNPRRIVVGGRLGRIMIHVETAIREGLLQDALPFTSDDLELHISSSHEDQLTGCMTAVLQSVLNNPPLPIRSRPAAHRKK